MHSRAFSLVELSIVLVILGLLVGGILAGQSLIRASELRSVSADFQKYETAINAFRDKYFALPGDMANATSFWGSAGGTGSDAACVTALANLTGSTCNGNGSGSVSGSGGADTYEATTVWQHLSKAGLVEGAYTGYRGSAWVRGTNTPASKISNAGFSFAYSGMSSGAFYNEYWNGKNDGNCLFFGATADIMRGRVITPQEAWNIDSKMDDGKPDTGVVTAMSTHVNCVTGSYPAAAYQIDRTTTECSLRYLVARR